MEIIQVRDLLRYKVLTVPAPEATELGFKQSILLKGKRESVVAEVVGLARKLPGAKVDEEFKFEKVLTLKDIESYKKSQTGEEKRLQGAQKEADKLGLNMYFFASQIGWQGKVVSFLFTSENPVDFRDLLKELTKITTGRIHLQRVDPRDRADIIGGPRCCGRPECCDIHISHKKISLDAVRDQGIMIKNNSKIYDVSGKLKRCLLHEVDLYKKYRKFLPHLKQEVTIEGKKARVTGLDILNGNVKVVFADTDVVENVPVELVEYPNKQAFPREPLKIEMPEIDIEGVGI